MPLSPLDRTIVSTALPTHRKVPGDPAAGHVAAPPPVARCRAGRAVGPPGRGRA